MRVDLREVLFIATAVAAAAQPVAAAVAAAAAALAVKPPRLSVPRCAHLPAGRDEELSAPSSRFACAWPRQSLWQLPSPAARYMCAAAIYTRSRSCSLLTPSIDKKIYMT